MDENQRHLAVTRFADALTIAGGGAAMARICRCSHSNISQLISNGSPLPAQYVLKVEAATGISRHELRPDIYPREEATA